MTELRSERLVLRPWTLEHTAHALRIYGDLEVTWWIGRQTAHDLDEMREQLAARIARTARYAPGLGAWAAWSGDAVIGTGLLKPLPGADGSLTDDVEVGWHLARDCWGQGYATEIGARLLQHGFETLQLPVIHAVVEPPNRASIRVAQRLGMRHTGRTTAYYDGLELEHFELPAP